ncbi:hypothetical protein EZV62_004050 [Acer yangbiense]|uniref:Uncharacterized protein n=1 Tax=Acer yangbiense TaxID=1000413 RepID=A0A5C7IJ50_9ROSI|nr:hypothetical protein EZV62_004050 [Acer yangbiense]
MDSEEIARLCATMTLKEREGPVRKLKEELKVAEMQMMSSSLVGKILMNQHVNREAFIAVMTKLKASALVRKMKYWDKRTEHRPDNGASRRFVNSREACNGVTQLEMARDGEPKLAPIMGGSLVRKYEQIRQLFAYVEEILGVIVAKARVGWSVGNVANTESEEASIAQKKSTASEILGPASVTQIPLKNNLGFHKEIVLADEGIGPIATDDGKISEGSSWGSFGFQSTMQVVVGGIKHCSDTLARWNAQNRKEMRRDILTKQ